MTKVNLVHRISFDAILTALYFALASVGISFGNVHLTLGSLPVVLAALLFGISDSCLIALSGELLIQFFTYGMTLTTAIWVIPPVLRGLIVGIFAHYYRKKGDQLEKHKGMLVVAVLSAAIVTTSANTLAMAVDAWVYQYPLAIVFLETILRFASGIASAVLVGFACLPLSSAIRTVIPFKSTSAS